MSSIGFTLALMFSGCGNPQVEELCRFPPRAVAERCVDCAWAHVWWVETRMTLDTTDGDIWHEWLVEARHCQECWSALRRVYLWQEAAPDQVRSALADLREVLGYVDFYAGRMPPPVPVWRFWRAD